MAKSHYQKLLKAELRIIGILLACVLLAAGWTIWRRYTLMQRMRDRTQSGQPRHQTAPETSIVAIEERVGQTEIGFASYYNDAFHGNPTASGEPYDKDDFSAAHREYPFGTRIRVTNLENGKSVIVRVNDRGPYNGNRVIDVSGRAANELELDLDGVTEVEIEVLE